MQLEKTNLMNTLFEFYGSLLTEKQQEYMHLYFAEDFSLGEIAAEFDVSRQAVYDNIKRTEVLLKEYENKLGMVSQFDSRKKHLAKMETYVRKQYPSDERLIHFINALEKDKESSRGSKDGI